MFRGRFYFIYEIFSNLGIGSKGSVVEIVDFEQEQVLDKIELANLNGSILSLSCNGSILSIVTPQEILLWKIDGDDKKLLTTITSDTTTFTCACFSPQGKTFAVADKEKVSIYTLD